MIGHERPEMHREFYRVIPQPLGEVTDNDIRAANMVAEALSKTGGPRSEVEISLPDGKKIKGFSFADPENREIIITPDFIATAERGQIVQFLPRN